MKEFDLTYRNIKLRIMCDDYMENLIKSHFLNHANFEEINGVATFSLIISDYISRVSGNYYKMVDKWFDNATLDCYIDNANKICYATNFGANTINYKNLLIQYFTANLFNRFLELEGYFGVHSSCVEKDGSGVLFVAGRNCGKTMCMLNLMNEGFNSVTNDKIALKSFENVISGYGIAQSVSIRLSPSFCSQPENYKYVELAKKRGINILNENMLEGNNIILNDTELADLNGVKQVFDTSINCIIQPFYDPSINSPIFEPLSEEQIHNLITSQYMSLVHDTTSFFGTIDLVCKDYVDTFITLENLKNIPGYFCRQNENTREEFVDNVKKLVLN